MQQITKPVIILPYKLVDYKKESTGNYAIIGEL
jgi:hypothetical protein